MDIGKDQAAIRRPFYGPNDIRVLIDSDSSNRNGTSEPGSDRQTSTETGGTESHHYDSKGPSNSANNNNSSNARGEAGSMYATAQTSSGSDPSPVTNSGDGNRNSDNIDNVGQSNANRLTGQHTSNSNDNTNSNQSQFNHPQFFLPAGSRNFKIRPCDTCRSRRTKCIFLPDENVCLTCKSRNRPCTFLEGPKRKRRRSKENPPQQEGSSNPKQLSGSNDNQVEDYASLKGPSLLKKTLGLQRPRCASFVGPTSELDYSVLAQAKFDDKDETELSPGFRLRRVADDAIFVMEDDSRIEGFDKIHSACDEIQAIVEPYGQTLVDLYFRIIHPSFLVLHKKVFLEKYARSHREFSPPLLAAVYSLALNWWSYASHLPKEKKPNTDKLDQLALKYFFSFSRIPKLSTVQAGLLLLQKRRVETATWSLVTQVVCLAEELGLYYDCRDWKIPRWERGLRRRLAWAVFVQDKWHALNYSRPSHIDTQNNWLVANLTNEDFPDKAADETDVDGSSDLSKGRLIFQHMVYLTQLVDLILQTFYTANSLKNLIETVDILDKAKPIQVRLRQWVKSLPAEISMKSIQSRQLSSNGYLWLAYLTTEITLHRRIIHSLKPDSHPELVTVCRYAARERLTAALEFADSLRPEHVQAFWHSSAPSNYAIIGSFAALLLVTSKTHDEALFYQTALKDYRWMIRLSSSGSTQLVDALEKLEASIASLPFVAQERRSMTTTTNNAYPDNEEYSEEEDVDKSHSNDNGATGHSGSIVSSSSFAGRQLQPAPHQPELSISASSQWDWVTAPICGPSGISQAIPDDGDYTTNFYSAMQGGPTTSPFNE